MEPIGAGDTALSSRVRRSYMEGPGLNYDSDTVDVHKTMRCQGIRIHCQLHANLRLWSNTSEWGYKNKRRRKEVNI